MGNGCSRSSQLQGGLGDTAQHNHSTQQLMQTAASSAGASGPAPRPPLAFQLKEVLGCSREKHFACLSQIFSFEMAEIISVMSETQEGKLAIVKSRHFRSQCTVLQGTNSHLSTKLCILVFVFSVPATEAPCSLGNCRRSCLSSPLAGLHRALPADYYCLI